MLILYIDFYLVLLEVLAVSFSQRQVGILVHKKSKRGETSLCRIIVKSMVIILKTE